MNNSIKSITSLDIWEPKLIIKTEQAQLSSRLHPESQSEREREL